jgi:hypothetical protein
MIYFRVLPNSLLYLSKLDIHQVLQELKCPISIFRHKPTIKVMIFPRVSIILKLLEVIPLSHKQGHLTQMPILKLFSFNLVHHQLSEFHQFKMSSTLTKNKIRLYTICIILLLRVKIKWFLSNQSLETTRNTCLWIYCRLYRKLSKLLRLQQFKMSPKKFTNMSRNNKV